MFDISVENELYYIIKVVTSQHESEFSKLSMFIYSSHLLAIDILVSNIYIV